MSIKQIRNSTLKWLYERFRRNDVVVEDISLILKAIRFAAHKHRSQRRSDKSASPYLNHPIGVADALWSVGEIHDINTIASAILHDTVEHTRTSLEELEAEFGRLIASIVKEVTEEKKTMEAGKKKPGGQKGREYIHVCPSDNNCRENIQYRNNNKLNPCELVLRQTEGIYSLDGRGNHHL